MIKGFRIHVKKGKLWLVLLEYGEREITFEDICEEVDFSQPGFCNDDLVQAALKAGTGTTIEISSDPPNELPGAIWIEYSDEDRAARIHIYPPIGNGRLFAESDVRRELEASGYKDLFVFTDIIRRNMETHRKSKVPVIFKAAEKRDAKIIVEISSDRRTAYLKYFKPYGGKRLSLEDAITEINNQGVKFGIDETRVREILENNRDVEQQRIAGAKEPVKGEDASVEYLFDAFHANSGPSIAEDTGCADFRELNLFENIEAGTPLARKTPCTLGENGMDVTGIEIVAEAGKDIPLPKGKNTTVSKEDPNLLIAQTAGSPKLVHGKINVDEILILNKVDFSTGNITFNGDVLVKGPVHPGFTITAEGDITCKDTVEAAHLKAGGNIHLKRGIKGMNKSKISAGNNIYARFIENSTVFAKESIIVDEAIIHSQVFANENIEVTHPKGSIFGGVIKARNLIRAANIGSEMAVKTDLEIGVAPQLREEIDNLTRLAETKRKELSKAEKNFAALGIMRKKKVLSDDREALFNKLGNVTKQLQSEIEEITNNIANLERDLSDTTESRVEAKKTIYPGVIITAKTAKRRISEPLKMAVFMKEGPDIVLANKVPEQS